MGCNCNNYMATDFVQYTEFGYWLNKEEYPNAKVPTRSFKYDAGFDLSLALREGNTYIEIPKFGRCIGTTGVHMQLQPGWEAQIRPRSGNAAKMGLTVLNSPGTIDSSYIGEIMVILYNASTEPIILNEGDRIAQMVIKKVPLIELRELQNKPTNDDRGSGGFGSTGK